MTLGMQLRMQGDIRSLAIRMFSLIPLSIPAAYSSSGGITGPPPGQQQPKATPATAAPQPPPGYYDEMPGVECTCFHCFQQQQLYRQWLHENPRAGCKRVATMATPAVVVVETAPPPAPATVRKMTAEAVVWVFVLVRWVMSVLAGIWAWEMRNGSVRRMCRALIGSEERWVRRWAAEVVRGVVEGVGVGVNEWSKED